MKFLKKLLGWLRSAAGTRGPLRVVVVLLVLAVVSILLGLLNVRLGLDEYIDVPWSVVRRLWLPLLFLLVCLNIWIGGTLYRLLTDLDDQSEFEDIDRAWEEARLGLRRAAIELDSLPVFLVLGEPAGGGRALFEASGRTFPVLEVPRRVDSPVRVSATRDAIFVTCPGASVLGRLATTLNARGDAAIASTPTPTSILAATPGIPSTSGAAGDVSSSAASGSASAVLEATTSSPSRSETPRVLLLSRSVEVDLITRRLRHLCGLIARDRAPFCPVNGILLLIPLACTGDDNQARQAGTICHLDFNTAIESLRVNCPVHAMVCDLENLPRIERLIQAFSPEQRLVAMGRTFPLSPDLDTSGRVSLVEQGVEWIGNCLIPPIILRLFRLEAPGESGLAEVVEHNDRLVEFLARTGERWKRLSRILGRFVSLDGKGALMLGGCHVACTGHDPEREQAFVGGVIQLLVDGQDYVSWTPLAIEDDRSNARLARLLNLASAAIAILATVAIFFLWEG